MVRSRNETTHLAIVKTDLDTISGVDLYSWNGRELSFARSVNAKLQNKEKLSYLILCQQSLYKRRKKFIFKR